MEFDLLLTNCDVLNVEMTPDGPEIRFLPGMDIAVRGPHITAIEPTGALAPGPATQVIRADHRLAIPGFINTHAHVPMVLFRGLAEDVTIEAWFNDYIWPLESNLTPEDIYWGALLGIAEMIEAGITCVADHYFAMDQVAQAVAESGIRANLVWAVFGHQGPEMLDQTCEFVARWQGQAEGRITTWMGPHAPYTCPPDFLRLAAQRAQELNVGIHIHVAETSDQVRQSLDRYGRTPIQILADTGVLERPTILAHCLYPQDEDYPLLQAADTGIAHAPKTYMKLGMGTAPLARFWDLGIPVGLATDGAVSSNTLDILEQLRLMALTQKDAARDPTVMPVAQALAIAFRGGAQVMHLADAIGELAPGKLADIVLLRQDGVHVTPRYNPAANLVYATRAGDVDTVIVHGRVLLQDGQLRTIDKVLVRREVTRRLDRLARRVPGRRIATYPA